MLSIKYFVKNWLFGLRTVLKKKKIILALCVTCVGLALVATILNISLNIDSLAGAITAEEAIEISKNSPTVQEQLQNADRYTIEVHYLNATRVAQLKEGRLELRLSPDYEFVPDGHDVWYVVWYIHPKGAASAVAVVIGHYIDEETGEILHEGHLIAF